MKRLTGLRLAIKLAKGRLPIPRTEELEYALVTYGVRTIGAAYKMGAAAAQELITDRLLAAHRAAEPPR